MKPPPAPSGNGNEYIQRLLHRWFVEYNPIYLVSAMLVLGGTFVASRALAREGASWGPLGVAAIAEVYALSLIGGAALLVRIEQRRPAVMLAMLTMLYQCDPTLHTETCAVLGRTGMLASLVWFVLFVIKAYALGWALRLRLSPRAVGTAVLGAGGLVLGPYLVPLGSGRETGAALAVFVFVLGSLRPEHAVSSLVPLSELGRAVLQRTVRATWIGGGLALALHVLFWSTQRTEHPHLLGIVAAVALVAARRHPAESRVWLVSAAVMSVSFVLAPSALATCAFLTAITLTSRALLPTRIATPRTAHAPALANAPYRVEGHDPLPQVTGHRVEATIEVSPDASARARLLVGAFTCLHLSAWTLGFRGGHYLEHVVALDIALVVALALVGWRFRSMVPIAPLGLGVAHALAGRISAPRNALEWGAASVLLGFALLGGSLVTSYLLRTGPLPRSLHPEPPKEGL